MKDPYAPRVTEGLSSQAYRDEADLENLKAKLRAGEKVEVDLSGIQRGKLEREIGLLGKAALGLEAEGLKVVMEFSRRKTKDPGVFAPDFALYALSSQ